MRLHTIALLVIAACDVPKVTFSPLPGDGTDAGGGGAIGATNGSRLRAVVEGDGTVGILRRWRDTQLGIDCEWIEAPGGELRCLPMHDDGLSNVVFSDAGCTQPILMSTACSAKPSYVRGGRHPCDPPTSYQVGAAITASGAYYYGVPGSCFSFGTVPPTDYTFHALTVASPALFVAGAHAREPRGARLTADVITGIDGSRDTRAIYDPTRGVHCARERFNAALPPTRCEPESFLNPIEYYADGGCSTQVAGWGFFRNAPFCGDAPTAVFAIGPALPDGADYHSVGAEVPSLFTLNATCQASPGFPSWRYFEIGALLDPAGWAPLTTTAEGTGRLQVTALKTPTGERLAASGFRDATLELPCTPATGTDGVVRCMPLGAAANSYLFADSACSIPVVVVAAGTPPPRYAVAYGGTGCGSIVTLSTVAARPGVAQLYNGGGTMPCVATTVGPGSDLYATTGAVAPSAFVPLTTAAQ